MTMNVLARFATPVLDRLLGRGQHAVTVPPMDGALQPNNRLEEATTMARIAAPDNLTLCGGKLVFSSGPELVELDPMSGATSTVNRLQADICAVAAMPGAGLAVGLVDGSVRFIGGPLDGVTAGRTFKCITAITAIDADTLAIAEGSSVNAAAQWRRDLLSHGSTGSVWTVKAGSSARQVAGGLAYPAGIALDSSGFLLVSESWTHRLLQVSEAGTLNTVLDDLPGYPGRLSPAADGGYWLCVFAPRSQLVEFVLREREFRERMMSEIAPEHWVAPALASGRDFREPLQGGAVKSMGVLKPWAPTRSYGLVCKLDHAFQPVWSAHSRADGRLHGITAAVETGGWLFACSQGGNEVVALATN